MREIVKILAKKINMTLFTVTYSVSGQATVGINGHESLTCMAGTVSKIRKYVPYLTFQRLYVEFLSNRSKVLWI